MTLRGHLLLFGSLILGLPLLMAFGETGLLLCLLLYFVALVLSGRILLREYREARLAENGPAVYVPRSVIFGMDAVAGTMLMLGIVVEVAAHEYGHIYTQLGFMLIVFAGIVWEVSILLAIVRYLRTRDTLILVVALTFFWISLGGIYFLLTAPPSSWGP